MEVKLYKCGMRQNKGGKGEIFRDCQPKLSSYEKLLWKTDTL